MEDLYYQPSEDITLKYKLYFVVFDSSEDSVFELELFAKTLRDRIFNDCRNDYSLVPNIQILDLNFFLHLGDDKRMIIENIMNKFSEQIYVNTDYVRYNTVHQLPTFDTLDENIFSSKEEAIVLYIISTFSYFCMNAISENGEIDSEVILLRTPNNEANVFKDWFGKFKELANKDFNIKEGE